MLGFFGVFGSPIEHSKSPFLHNHTFENLSRESRLSGYYSRILLEDGDKLRERFYKFGLLGANVTIPFKEKAFAQCDEVRGIARQIGACNTLVKEGDSLIGYNTDADGFYTCIQSFAFKSALIIGAGGAARAIAMILASHHIPTTLINRSAHSLEFFAQQGFETYSSADFTPSKAYELIINTTSAGLNDNALPCSPLLLDSLFAQATYAFDLIYGKITPFLARAQKHNLAHSDGAQMLINQAVLASELFYSAHSSHIVPRQKISTLMNQIFAQISPNNHAPSPNPSL